MRWQNHAASITITRHHSLQHRYFLISMSKQGLYLLSDTTSHTLDAELPIKSQSDIVSLTHSIAVSRLDPHIFSIIAYYRL